MKARHYLFFGIAFLTSCAGNAERNGNVAASGTTSSGGAEAPGGKETTGGSTATGGSELTGGSGERDYVPDHPDQPVQGDGRVAGGSFEQSPGIGWDTCFTRNAGAAYASGEPASADGDHCFTFDSRRACAESLACRPDGGDAQLGFWLDSVVPAGDAVHLYFDATNLGTLPLNGQIGIDAVGGLCQSTEVLARLPLAELDLGPSWQTRCVSFIPREPFQTLGVHVTGTNFYVALDTFRFGPPCHD